MQKRTPRRLVITCGNPAKAFSFFGESLYKMTFFAGVKITVPRVITVAPRRYNHERIQTQSGVAPRRCATPHKTEYFPHRGFLPSTQSEAVQPWMRPFCCAGCEPISIQQCCGLLPHGRHHIEPYTLRRAGNPHRRVRVSLTI